MAVLPIKAVLLATSESSQLHPLTENIPSPMVPVVNRPVMAYMVEMLARQDIKNIIVSVFRMAGQIEGYFGNGRRWAVSLEYALQSQPLGSAGSLKWAQPLLGDTFLVLPGDCLLDLDVEAVLAHHKAKESAVTIIERNPKFFTNPENSSDPISEPSSRMSGAYVFNSRVLELIPARTPFDIQKQLIPAVGNAGLSVSCFEMGGYSNVMQSFADCQAAQRAILRSNIDGYSEAGSDIRFFSLNGRKIGNGVWIGENQVIHPNARLTPPVYIGDNCYIGRDVELGPDTVIGSNVVIDDEATITQSTILDGTYVGQLVNVEERLVNKNLIIDLKTADFMYVTDDFLLSQSYRADIDRGLKRILDITAALPAILPAIIISIPLTLLLLLTTGRAFRKYKRQFNRPMAAGEAQKVIFNLVQFNVEGKKDGYNWLGRILTRLELHRLPELWNLVKGDLQLVGVKALSPEEIGRCNEPWQQIRHEQRPGLTGLWYVNTKQNSELDEFVVADIYYLATKNWREELRILWQTPISWVRRVQR